MMLGEGWEEERTRGQEGDEDAAAGRDVDYVNTTFEGPRDRENPD
jgi:hypothetical protein